MRNCCGVPRGTRTTACVRIKDVATLPILVLEEVGNAERRLARPKVLTCTERPPEATPRTTGASFARHAYRREMGWTDFPLLLCGVALCCCGVGHMRSGGLVSCES